jgi:oligopeptide transport system substrate-binding protein
MRNKKRNALIAVLLIGSTLLAACAPPATPETVVEQVEVTRVIEQEGETVVETVVEEVAVEVVVTATPAPADEMVTLDRNYGTDIAGLDPQRAEDTTSIEAIENLFVGLTDYDDTTGEVLPELATSWEQTVNDDGTADWTFHLRDDINWVYYNPMTEETGVVRPVTAQDVVYAVQRACSPEVGTYYSDIVGSYVIGCGDYLSYDPEAEDALPLEDVIAGVGAEAPDDMTVVFHLLAPVGYWPAIAGMWTIRPTPQETIDQFGPEWVEAGNIVTNGPYVLGEWIHSVSTVFLKNPHWTGPFPGNVEKVQIHYINDVSTEFALFLDNGLDWANVPAAELEAFKAESPELAFESSDLAVFYLSFFHRRPPFDDQKVREAFALGLDRQAFIDVARSGEGVVMTHFTPPGMFGAPPINEVGVSYDPERARELLAEAGYPNCEGFPTIEFLTTSSDRARMWAETYAAIFSESLGCPVDTFNIIQQEFRVYLATLSPDTPDEEMPHMWSAGWGPDYADADNWLRAVVHCEDSENNPRRECSAADELIKELQFETDAQTRIDGYRQVEEMFFGPGGEFPFAPCFLRIETDALQTWLEFDPAELGGHHYNNWVIDWEAKKAAQSD